MTEAKEKAAGYDKYVNWKLLVIPVVLFFFRYLFENPGFSII